MQILGYHNHNFFCDGKESIEKYIQEAINQNVNSIGVSSHAPFFFFNKWSVDSQNLNNYSDKIDKLAKKYSSQIDVYKSLEIDYLPGKIAQFKYFKDLLNLDYTIGSIHYVQHPDTNNFLFIDGPRENFDATLKSDFDNDLPFLIKNYFRQTKNMIRTQKPDIVGHIDKIAMNGGERIRKDNNFENWYKNEVIETLNMAAQEGIIIEINLRGLIKGKYHTTFIDEYFLPVCRELGINMIISTDAHHPSEVNMYYFNALRILKKHNIEYLMKFNSGIWEPYSIKDYAI